MNALNLVSFSLFAALMLALSVGFILAGIYANNILSGIASASPFMLLFGAIVACNLPVKKV